MKRWIPALFMVAASLLLANTAAAVPQEVSGSDDDGDSEITLTILNQYINEDNRSWCSIRIQDNGGCEDGPGCDGGDVFAAGDKVFLFVKESDGGIGNDDIWETSFTVTAEEVSNDRVDRTIDCSATFGTDGFGNNLEIYAEARIEKDDTCGVCRYDRPSTSNLDVATVEDDNAEEDDTSDANSPAIGLGTTPNRISRDQDWLRFETTDRSRVTAQILHRPGVGRLELSIFNDNNSQVASGSDNDGNTEAIAEELEAGIYYLRVNPRVSNDFNFYDARLIIDTLAADCVANTEESQACGNCGTETRRCDNNGRWGPYDVCSDEGVCAPGSEMIDSCGLCGTITTTCSDACAWVEGSCGNEGICEPGTMESEACAGEGGERARTCDDSCAWGDYGACGGDCEPDEMRDCYTGPPGTVGVGVCQGGAEACVMRTWLGECRGEVLPGVEAMACDDNLDNDCDGMTDADDPDCAAPGAMLGESCEDDDECEGDFDCVGTPQDAVFTNGYCSMVDCSNDDECGSNGTCGMVFGALYCLKECTTDADCRSGYICADVQDEQACIPRCRENAHCRDDDFPICDQSSGLCSAEETGTSNGTTSTSNGTSSTSNGTSSSSNGTSSTSNGTSSGSNGTSSSNGTSGTSNGTTDGTTAPVGEEASCGCATPTRPAKLPYLPAVAVAILLGFASIRFRK